MPTGTHYCYETKNKGGCGKVIGEYTVWRVRRYEDVSHIPDDFITLGCVSRDHLRHYSGYSKHKPLYAHFIVRPIRYDELKELGEFSTPCKMRERLCGICDYAVHGMDGDLIDCNTSLTRPPQSWCYVERGE